MDIKQKYREELNKEPYCQTKTGAYVKSGTYSDEYVKWLEKQLSISRVSNSLDLVEFERKIDKILDNATSESLKKWLHSKRL